MKAVRTCRGLYGAMLLLTLTTLGCQSMKPIETVSHVDLERFMGEWYVVANIPTIFEKDAYNPLESYRLNDDGSIATTFTFNKGAFDGPLKTFRPTAFVRDQSSNAVWGMQFIWPFKAEYRIIYLEKDYSLTVIGRTKRDYLWIMARTPFVDDDLLATVFAFVEQQGYDTTKIERPPHRQPSKQQAP